MEGEPAIYLSDPVWRDIAISLWDTDGDGYISEDESQIYRVVNFADYSNTGLIKVLDFRNLPTEGISNTNYLSGIKEIYWGIIMWGTALPYEGFKENLSLELFDIGTYIINTERMTFQNCTSLKKVVLNNILERIDGGAFSHCSSLVEISDIPDSCTRIGGDWQGGCFEHCISLKQITIGTGMQRIDEYCFYGCSSMESFYIKATVPPTLGGNVFGENPCKIYVPRSSVDAYKSAINWNQYAARIYGYDF
ncbi:leucine-rich repeat domain-containing protein [Bacteroides timonensis]|uniref:leucine-rich repeat domain-containing protein n=1 Tax=Bacteroides timonensis TaxID=1470345 RepID=UPI0004BCDE3A|nr:leucine-rich repeat domain-containing protein [Bacteroides timonensis]